MTRMGFVAALCAGLLASGAFAQTQTETPETGSPGTGEDAAPGGTSPGAPREDAAPDEGSFLDKLPIELGGEFWVDTGYLMRDNGEAAAPDQNTPYMQGRFVLGASYRHEFSGGWYGLAKAEFIAHVNEPLGSDFPRVQDSFVRAGNATWDLTVGRFLAWEVYYRGLGIDRYTAEEAGAYGAPTLYHLNVASGHRDESGQAAFHLYPLAGLSIEIASVYGQETKQNNYGVRPVIDYRLGGLHLAAGAEYLTQVGQIASDRVRITTLGYAGNIRYTFGPATLGAGYTRQDREYVDIQGDISGRDTYVRDTFGGTLDVDLWSATVGVGYHRVLQLNHQDEQTAQDQLSVAYLHRFPIKGLSVKAVYAFYRGDLEAQGVTGRWNNDMQSVRVRVAYDFD